MTILTIHGRDMKKTKYGPKTLKRFAISDKLYKEGLSGTVVTARGGMAKAPYLRIKKDLDAKKTP